MVMTSLKEEHTGTPARPSLIQNRPSYLSNMIGRFVIVSKDIESHPDETQHSFFDHDTANLGVSLH
jgi:hypothetical protein